MSKPTIEGCLQKRGFWGRWKSSTFAVHNNNLLEYKDEEGRSPSPATAPKKVVATTALQGMTVTPAAHLTGKNNSFCLFGDKGKGQIFFNASSQDEMSKWINVLSSATGKSASKFTLADSTLEAFNDAVVVADEKGVICGVNEKAVDLFGYANKNEMVGVQVTILMPHSYAVNHHSYMANYHSTGIKRLIGKPRVLPSQKKDGSKMNIELSLGEMEDNGARRFVATMRLQAESGRNSPSNRHSNDIDSQIKLNGMVETFLEKFRENIPEELRKMGDESNRELERNIQLMAKKNEQLRRQLAMEKTAHKALTRLIKKSKVVMTHLEELVRGEIASCRSITTIFREDSAFTKLIKSFFMGYGLDYLESTIGVTIRNVVAKYEATSTTASSAAPPTLPMPSEISGDELASFCTSVLHSILASNVPSEFKIVAGFIKDAIDKKLQPAEARRAYRDSIANIMFLRFLVPAITAPQRYGLIVDKPKPEAAQFLVMASRVTMHLVNGTTLNSDSMTKVNAFIEDNKTMLDDWIEHLLL